jgi:S-adenosylmethionine decarboxylase
VYEAERLCTGSIQPVPVVSLRPQEGGLLGWHWLAQVSGAPSERLVSPDVLTSLLSALPDALGLRAVAAPTVRPVEGGLAGMVLLAESHAAVHTSVAEGAAFVDVFSCRRHLDAQLAEAVVREHLHAGEVRGRLVRRGPEGMG